MPLSPPLVSVAICTYNGEKYLTQQLESIINQTYLNLEIIIIDDCSTDGTFELIKSLTKDLGNIRIEQNASNLGFIKNFEKAISYCNGEYITTSDQDDIWDLEKVEILVKNIGNHGLIYHDSLIIDNQGNTINNIKLSDKTKIYEGSSNLYFLANNCISGHASMFTKEILNYAMPFDKRFFHDWWIAFVAASVSSIKYIPNTLVSYRQHDNNVTNIFDNSKSKIGKPGNIYFTFDIEWIEYLSNFKFSKNQSEINHIYRTLLDYSKGKKGINFFKFLLKYYTKIFNLKSKSTLSNINLARKIYTSKIIIGNSL